MELKGLLLISMLFGASLAQNLTCRYTDMVIDGETHYGCFLVIVNPDGLDDFTSIEGEHVEGRTDADVTAIFTDWFNSETSNFPQILCSQFPNMEAVDFSWMSVTELTESTLSGCRNLELIKFWMNRIETVHENAFANNPNLYHIDLVSNRIAALPENIFSNLAELEELMISNNPLESIPNGLFRNLGALKTLVMRELEIVELNSQWFSDLAGLESLSVTNNNLTTLSEDIFSNLRNLISLEINNNPINSLPDGVFRPLTNLRQLFMSALLITEINPEWYNGLDNLFSLDINFNHLTDSAIPSNTFSGIRNLNWLDASRNLIMNLNPAWFEDLTNLTIINLDGNQVQALPSGIFAPITALEQLDMMANSVKTIHRDSFGNIGSLSFVDFDDNVINAIDEQFLKEAEPLNLFYLWGNLCTGERFYSFAENRDVFLPRLALCTTNYRFIVDTETVAGEEYAFFESMDPGLQFRVTSESSVSIALTSFDVPWNPMIEIVLGANNNTVSQIIRNQEQVVVNVPTPNILRSGEASGFRITWSNNVILVTREDQAYPFMAYTQEDFYSIHFFGLKSSETDAVWSIQPVEGELVPTKN